MKQLSTAQRFKLVTGVDIYKKFNELKKASEGDFDGMTELQDFLHYGLYLTYEEKDLQKARSLFADFDKSKEFNTDGQTLEELMTRFAPNNA
ncbi:MULTISPECIES: hypothetical protein [unclassified Lactococcus]|uniref:hypothetical protein n=1 Tax=unclassified Lactococcus TaxID=2643510 RepID=UPI0011C819B1|nr:MULTISPECIES: hypothetical protein [unclassified Lactococcus]MQW22000.1 hypothetical protein [Lactococcus sp. dk101]TXK36820.1 hypothetical protein FVP42_10615 [Lactococcus sp. dk310]TXK47483.1 hypothetical protein FVP43_10230 [Lactococcus sp. dk322]